MNKMLGCWLSRRGDPARLRQGGARLKTVPHTAISPATKGLSQIRYPDLSGPLGTRSPTIHDSQKQNTKSPLKPHNCSAWGGSLERAFGDSRWFLATGVKKW